MFPKNKKLKKWASIYATLAVVAFVIPTAAEAMTMENNVNDLAEQMERWSKQCASKPLTPEAQAKLSALLMEASQLLKQIPSNAESDMQMQYHKKIMKMKEEWNPFDTLYGN